MGKNETELDQSSDAKVEIGLSRRVLAALERSQSAIDLDYFSGHATRYTRTVNQLCELVPSGSRVLDVGSHFLHQSMLLSDVGFAVTGIDVPAFVEQPLVKERATAFGIQNSSVADFGGGEFLTDMQDAFNAVVFTEIQEHITFNPILFWRRVYQLLTPGGVIYLTTPNSLRIWNQMSVLKDLLLQRRIGNSLDEILRTVTYGHHWKEYSAAELRHLFRRLSRDFETKTSTTFRYRRPVRVKCFKTLLQRIVSLTHVVPGYGEEIECIVRLRRKTVGFTAIAPKYS